MFWRMDDPESSYRRGTGESFKQYVWRSIAVSPQPRWFQNIMLSPMARDHLSNEVNGCQGTPWSEELDGKKLHGALRSECDQEPRGSSVSRRSSVWSTHLSTPSTGMVLC